MSKATRLAPRLVLLGSILVGLIACSADSLWIDEASVALIASEPTLAGWWRRLQEVGGSTLQMPLYNFYLWVWEKLAGHSEYALRAANIPFFALGQWAMFRSLRRDTALALSYALIAGISPFLWSYLAEARPYAMQFGGACLVVAGLLRAAHGERVQSLDAFLFCAGAVISCGASTLAFPWVGTAFLGTLFFLRFQKDPLRFSVPEIAAMSASVIFIGAIFAFDLWAARHGGSVSTGQSTWQNILYAGYELLGFAGLGPARLDIRESQSLSVLVPYAWPLSGLALTLLLTLFLGGRIERRTSQAIILYALLPLMFIVTLTFIAPLRLLGRHITPVAPALFLFLAYALDKPSQGWINRAFLAFWLVSALSLRFQTRHHRDDYRDAAKIGRDALARGERVWWIAEAAGAEYYRLPLAPPNQSNDASALLAANLSDYGHAPRPDIVILSKVDLYDGSGGAHRFLEINRYERIRSLPAFSIWAAPDSSR